MNVSEVKVHLGNIVRASTRLKEIEEGSPESYPAEINTLNLGLGIATGSFAREFLDFPNRTIKEAEVCQVLQCLPSQGAKSVFNLAVQMSAHIFFSRRVVNSTLEIPDEDAGRDNPANEIRDLAPTLNPETLMPKKKLKNYFLNPAY